MNIFHRDKGEKTTADEVKEAEETKAAEEAKTAEEAKAHEESKEAETGQTSEDKKESEVKEVSEDKGSASDKETALDKDAAEDTEVSEDKKAAEDKEPAEDEDEEDAGDEEDVEEEEDIEEEEDEDSGDDEEEGESGGEAIRTKHHRGRRGHGFRKFLKGLGIFCGVILVMAAVAYAGFAIFFQSHFLFYTTINGVDFSMKDVSQVEEYMSQQVADYTLTLVESDGKTEVVKGSDIGAEYVPGDQLTELLEAQNVMLWPESLVEHPQIEASVGVTYDEDKLEAVLDELNCTDEDNQTPSENAMPVYQSSAFIIQPEVIGTELDTDVFAQAVSTAINGFQDELNMKDADCYLLPEYVSTSPEVAEAAEEMNKYLSARITYDMSPDEVVVDADQISQWVKVNQETMAVSLKQGSVKEFVSDLADQYDTYGHDREFETASGKTVTVTGGNYGWQIDQDEETEALLKDIQEGTVVEREPAYSRTAASHGSSDLGSTYAEVDLTNQHMYYTKDGEVVLESDVVTGNPNKGNGTPQGTYSIMYKERNATLKGDRQPDGSYGYETPVAYWMPFNGGIGFHDATWQSSFGGDRYLTHGSHGCVNMPKSKAEELYGLISTGDPVVCYY